VLKLLSGQEVRVLSRSTSPRVPDGVAAVRGDLAAGWGIDEAVAGADIVAHLATGGARRVQQTDVDGTRRLADAARRAGVTNFFYISIVGIDREPISHYGYYAAKLAAERAIEASGVPHTILRATQFPTLIHMFLALSDRLPAQLAFRHVRFQLLDVREAAERCVAALTPDAGGRLPDVGGPRVETMETLACAYLRHRASRKPLVQVSLPGKAYAGFRLGQNLCPENPVGSLTWEDYLDRVIPAPR
jgi:uncharacterized protein YbjT (DUF2867 family)